MTQLVMLLALLVFCIGCNRGPDGKPPVSVSGGGTVNGPPSDVIKIPDKPPQ